MSSPARRRTEARRAITTFREKAAHFRDALRGYERALDRVDRRMQSRTPLHQVMQDVGISGRRDALVGCLDDFETARHRMRVACFRVSLDEGLTIADVAREWGISRQLVSRMLNEDVEARTGPQVRARGSVPGTLAPDLRATPRRPNAH